MFKVVIDIGVIVAVDGLDAATQERENRVAFLFGHVVGDGLSAAVEHADAVAEFDPQFN